MRSNLKKLKDCKVMLEVEVEPELVENRLQSILREFQKSATLPGFRGGKAPLDLIEKKFIKEAEEEVLKTLIPEAYHASIATHKVPRSHCRPFQKLNWSAGKNSRFRRSLRKRRRSQLKIIKA